LGRVLQIALVLDMPLGIEEEEESVCKVFSKGQEGGANV
jgi:hypothetical protein